MTMVIIIVINVDAEVDNEDNIDQMRVSMGTEIPRKLMMMCI